jgi:outer membrane protein insertion porin family
MSALLAAAFCSRAEAQEASSSTLSGVGVSSSAPVSVSSSPAAAEPAHSPAAPPAPLPGLSTGTWPSPAPEPEPPASGAVPSPWVIGDIKADGLKNVKFSVIRGQVKARKGDLYDRPELDRDIQSLLGLGQFERVGAEIALMDKAVPEHFAKAAGASKQVTLTFTVKEKPVIKKFIFEGNKKLSKGYLQDQMALKTRDPYDRFKLEEDRAKITAKYREKGFLDASVETEVRVDTAASKAEIVYKVAEGAKSRIQLVEIAGVTAFKPKKLLKLMTNRRKKVYVEKELEADVEKIETHYKNNGFLDVRLSTPVVTMSPDKTKISIGLGVIEGRSYRFGDTTFTGNEVIPSSALAKALDYRKGKIFNQEKFEFTIRSIQEQYADTGRLHMRVTPVKTHNPATDLMDVRYEIVENHISYVAHVDVEGNKATKTYVLAREIVIKPGDPFSASRVRKSREKILNLGFIDDVEFDLQPAGEDKVDLTFDVSEGKPGVLTAGAAYSSIDGLIGTLSLQHLNLFGRAQKASVQWSFGRRVQDYSISWTTPWVANKPVSLGVDVFNTRRVNPFDTSLSAYVERRTGGTVRVGPRFSEDKYQLNFSYSLSRIQIQNIEQQFLGTLSEGTSILSSFGTEFARDTRDSIWDPTRGTRNSLGFNLAGGPFQGDIHLFKPYFANQAHWTMFTVEDWPFVLSFYNRGAYATQFDKTKQVPVQDRYFIGGQDSLRGYNPSGEAGFRQGGKVYDVANLEFGFPLARERRKTIVKLVFFGDVGGAWDRVRDVSGRFGTGERDLKADIGFGLRFVTPAFPIRLDYGYGLHHRPGERLYQINFGLGPLF